jgi:lysophospholipase L1-like esterase
MQWVSDSLLDYRLNPAPDDVPGGFLGQAPPRPRREGLLVICLGGSTTYGHGLPWRKAWPHVTQGIVRARGTQAFVINAGTPGYGSRQLLRRYQLEIAALAPDYVIVFEGWNRTGILVDSSSWVPFGARGSSRLTRVIRAAAVHSLMIRAASTQLARRRTVATAAFKPDRFQSVWEADMDSLVRVITAHDQHPLLVIYPSLYHENMTATDLQAYAGKGWKSRPFDPRMLDEIRDKHAALRRIARERRAGVIDVQGAIATLHGAERAALFFDEWHLSVAGNHRVAELVAETLTGAPGNPASPAAASTARR